MIEELRGNKVKQDYYRDEMNTIRYQYDNMRPDRDQFQYETSQTEKMRELMDARRGSVHRDPGVDMAHRAMNFDPAMAVQHRLEMNEGRAPWPGQPQLQSTGSSIEDVFSRSNNLHPSVIASMSNPGYHVDADEYASG